MFFKKFLKFFITSYYKTSCWGDPQVQSNYNKNETIYRFTVNGKVLNVQILHIFWITLKKIKLRNGYD